MHDLIQPQPTIEAGNYVPSTVLALKIARYFGKPADSIFQLDEND